MSERPGTTGPLDDELIELDREATAAPRTIVDTRSYAEGGPQRRGRGRKPDDPPTRIDSVFARVTHGSGAFVLVVLVLIAVFLTAGAWKALRVTGWSFFTTSAFSPTADPPTFGVVGLMLGTVVVAVLAIAIAIPVSVLTALFITEIASARWRQIMITLVDLLAALPSLLYGLWGFAYLTTKLPPVSVWLSAHLGWIPIFEVDDGAEVILSYFGAGVVVSLMTLPIITSVVREVFAQVPPGEKEAALALGSTRWSMIRTVVLPFGRAGIIGGSMLGLGRALGETIACALLLPQIPTTSVHLFQMGGSTAAGYIARNVGLSELGISALLAVGLVLFAFTLTTNFVASIIVARSRSGAGVDA